MGQSSSAGSKTALPTNNLLIDASDSYVTDVKLRSTAIIPISEYIKKDKNSKRLQQLKKNVSEEKIKNKKLKDDKATNKTPAQKEDKKGKNIKPFKGTEDVKEEKKRFIESSFTDIPNNRKWVNIYSKAKPQTQNEAKNIKNRKTQTTLPPNEEKTGPNIQSPSSEEIKQLYKNKVYPHIYKNRYSKKPDEKRPKSVPAGSDNNIKERFEESTHQLNQHHYHSYAQNKIRKHDLSVQTNVACVIHPDRKKQTHFSSNESIKRKYPTKVLTPVESSSYSAIHRHNMDNLDKITKSHRKYLSGKQALENWKNIHTLKQHRKLNNSNNYYSHPEEDHRYDNEEYDGDYYSSRPVRSRAGYREDEEQKMTPLQISNYNYSRAPQNPRSSCISPKEIKERNEKLKRNPRMHPPFLERDFPRYEYIENSSCGKYPPKYRNWDDERSYYRSIGRDISERDARIMEREDFIEDMERCLRNKIASVYGRMEGKTQTPNKTTWVQDKYRRWHKVVME